MAGPLEVTVNPMRRLTPGEEAEIAWMRQNGVLPATGPREGGLMQMIGGILSDPAGAASSAYNAVTSDPIGVARGLLVDPVVDTVNWWSDAVQGRVPLTDAQGRTSTDAIGRAMDIAGSFAAPTFGARVATGAPDPNTVSMFGAGERRGRLYGGADIPDDVKVQQNIAKVIERTPEFENLLPYLTAEELSAVTSQMGDKILRGTQVGNLGDMQGGAVAGAGKLGWYRESANAMSTIFGEDINRFSSLLAALSPQTSVEMNMMNAARTWANWVKAGRPKDPNEILDIMGRSVVGDKGKDSILDAWKNNAISALSQQEGAGVDDFRLSGPKVDSFRRNVAGDLVPVTNDAWESHHMGVPQDAFSKSGTNLPGYGGVYLGKNIANRQVAENMSKALGFDIAPAEVQEMNWSFTKALYEQMAENRGRGGPSALDIVQEGLLDEKRVADVPDFASLLQDDRYGGPLKEIGLGPEIDKAAGAVGRIGGRDLSAAANPAGARNIARRVDALYDTRQFVSATAPFRARPGSSLRADGGRDFVLGPYGKQSSGFVSLDWGAKGRIHQVTPEYSKAVQSTSVTPVETFAEIAADGPSRQAWIDKMRAAQQSRGALGRSVDVYNRSGYKGAKVFSTPDGNAGFAVKPDGELSSVVSMKGQGPVGFSDSAVTLAVQNGATWLNAFDTVLPGKYGRHGFKPVARLPFDEQMARAEWGDAAVDEFMRDTKRFNNGRPDLVFMVYDPDFADKVPNRIGGRLAKSYDDAMRIVERSKTEVANKANKAKPAVRNKPSVPGLLDEQ